MATQLDTSQRQAAAREPAEVDAVVLDAWPSRALPGSESASPPVGAREIAAVAALVALCDLTIYRGAGYAGLALLFAAVPALLALGKPQPRWQWSSLLLAGLLVLLAGRLVWQGSLLSVVAGFMLILAFALTLGGHRPYVPDVAATALLTGLAGFQGLARYAGTAARVGPSAARLPWLSVLLPLGAIVLFGMLFILANPDVAASFFRGADRILQDVRAWLQSVGGRWTEAAFWLAVALVAAGLLRPLNAGPVLENAIGSQLPDAKPVPGESSPLYTALRNTLVAVVVLFAAYLIFEFKTLWFRQFPPGFYYAGYAHEGAAWLTVALAAATLILSLAFRGRVLTDPRLGRIKRLAWIWSAESFLLALAVYHRMYIYIDFNGMTRMRTIGLFGITAVLVGFCLVVWKIARHHSFLWLIQRQLWTLAAAVLLFALTPVDAIVHTYNVNRVMAGDLAPSVQISVHPISAEGVLVLHPLLNSDDPIIREGIRALLAQRAIEADRLAAERSRLGWTAYQAADAKLLEQLLQIESEWNEYADDAARAAALGRFHAYVYQWY